MPPNCCQGEQRIHHRDTQAGLHETDSGHRDINLQRGGERDTLRACGMGQFLGRSRVAAIGDHIQPGEVSHRDLRPIRERMALGQKHYKTNLTEHFRLDIRRQTVIHRESEARIARAQELTIPEIGAICERRRMPGLRARKAVKAAGKIAMAGGGDAATRTSPARPGADPRSSGGYPQGQKRGALHREQLQRLWRCTQAPLHPLEQREAQFILGMQQDLAQGGLRNVERARRGSHRSGAHHGDENLELARAHDHSIGLTYGNGKHRSLTRANPPTRSQPSKTAAKSCPEEWRMDAIVLGGGLMGTATAYFLARRGVRVTLIEKNRIGTGATLASFGNIRRSGRHLTQLPLAHRSRRLWGELQDMLGRDVEFRATGHLRLIFDEDGLADMRAYAEAARPWGLELDELGPERGARALSRPRTRGHRSLLLAGGRERQSTPHRPGFRGSRASAGRDHHRGGRRDEPPPHAHGFRVECAKGVFEAETLVNAAGAWGARVAERFGEPVPLTPWGPQMAVTEPCRIASCRWSAYGRAIIAKAPICDRWSAGTSCSAVRLSASQWILIPATPMPIPRDCRPMRAVIRLVPALAQVSVIRTWSGVEGYLPDMLPVMGQSKTTPGLFHAFGFSGSGFQLGPGVGETMAELITTGRTDIPLDDFRIDRFGKAA